LGAFFCSAREGRAKQKNRAFRSKSSDLPMQILWAFRCNPSRERQLKTSSRNCRGNSGAANCLWQLAARNPAVAILSGSSEPVPGIAVAIPGQLIAFGN
jgi:hypothetical protein